jgi:DNA invertase Pin-like site-specific DNA recombinase
MTLSQRTAIYARVSSDQQVQQDTIASPLATVQAYATGQGLKVDPDLIFADNGSSGTTLARPKLDALRDRAAAGEIEQILILNPDRLARKYTHQLMLVEEFKNLGVAITFVNRQIATSPEDQLLLQMQGVIAEYEREKIVERHRRGKLHKAQQGKVCVLSGAPYGYVYIPATDTEEARYAIHEREAAVVQRVFHRLVDEGQSIGAIARLLTAERVPTRRDVGRWERSVVWAMLRNPARGKPPTVKPKSSSANGRPSKRGITASIPNTPTPALAIAPKRIGFAFPSRLSLVKRCFSAPMPGWKQTNASRRATISGMSICSAACSAVSTVGMRCMANPPPTPSTNGSTIGVRARMAIAGKAGACVPRIPSGWKRWMTWCGNKPVNCSNSPS